MLSTFECSQHVLGLNVNNEKIEIFPIGSDIGIQLCLYNNNNIKWSPEHIKALGIYLTIYRKTAVIKNQSQLVYQLSAPPAPNVLHK